MATVTATIREKVEIEKGRGHNDADDTETEIGVGSVIVTDLDPLDPKNWPRWRKRVCLGLVMWMYFLFTYITTTTIPSFPSLQHHFSLTLAQTNWTVAIPALGLSLGPLFWSPPASVFGRRPTLLAGTLLALIASVVTARADAYGVYMAARFVQGFGVSPAATVGLAVVQDLFAEEERGRMVGMWVLALDMGLVVGPLVGGFMAVMGQEWVAWHVAVLFALLLAAQLCWLPETLYLRAVGDEELRRTKKLPWLNLRRVPGVVPTRLWMFDALLRFAWMAVFPNVAVAVGLYCFAWYWWVLSVVTYMPVAYAQYSALVQGLLFGGLILGTLLCEVFCSGALSDAIVARLAKRNYGMRVPEMRLWLWLPAAGMTAAGLTLWGISIDRQYHWFIGQLALFLFAAGIQVGNTAVSAYIVDCYPAHAMSVITFYSVLLNMAAFVNPFFIEPWVVSFGFTWTFAAQGLVVVGVMLPVLAVLMRWGAGWRERRGEPWWPREGDSMR